MQSPLHKAIQSVQQAEVAYSKYITANDTGNTGGHQAGFHIHKNAWPLFFDQPGNRGENKDKQVVIKWQDDFETSSWFRYYGVGTRNEYRLTRFGRGFPFLSDECIGDLLVISKKSDEYYEAFVIQSDEEIEEFFAALSISSNETNKIIPKNIQPGVEGQLLRCFEAYVKSVVTDFPLTSDLATSARKCYNGANGINGESINKEPDLIIIEWLEAEFQLFKLFENNRYSERIKTPFDTVERLVETANTILNRRKSRAGKSLEHHLSEVFRTAGLLFEPQAVTEDNKKPDFLFPGRDAYSDPRFNHRNLIMLAAKTTCKDRWRQVLNEADKIKTKHLFTLQQGISLKQLEEMYKYGVCLVVPKDFLKSFPMTFRDRIMTLGSFLKFVRTKQSAIRR